MATTVKQAQERIEQQLGQLLAQRALADEQIVQARAALNGFSVGVATAQAEADLEAKEAKKAAKPKK